MDNLLLRTWGVKVKNTDLWVRDSAGQLFWSNSKKVAEVLVSSHGNSLPSWEVSEFPPTRLILEQNDRTLAIQYAWTFLGTWYSWRGENPAGFDCSGLCNELLKATGKIARKTNYTAQELFDLFKDKEVDKPSTGCLVFTRPEHGFIIHVEFCIDEFHTIGASGGDRNTKTREDAIRDNAFVKIRPVSGTVFCDPFRE